METVIREDGFSYLKFVDNSQDEEVEDGNKYTIEDSGEHFGEQVVLLSDEDIEALYSILKEIVEKKKKD